MTLLLLGQIEKLVTWLTPVWVIAVGISLGYIAILVFLLAINGLGRMTWLSRIGTSRVPWIVAGVVLSLGLMAMAMVAYNAYVGDVGRYKAEVRERLPTQWMLFAGFSLAISSIVGFGFWKLISPRGLEEANIHCSEGFLAWVSRIFTALTIFSAIGLILGFFPGFGVPRIVDDPRGLVQSLMRIPYTGEKSSGVFELPPSNISDQGTPIKVDFSGAELRGFSIKTNQELEIAAVPITPLLSSQKIIRVPSTAATEEFRALKGAAIGNEYVEHLYVLNRGANTATVEIKWLLLPVYPEIQIVPWIVGFVFIGYVVLLCGLVLMPKISAISLATFKSEVTQPLYMLIMIVGALFVVVSIFIPYNTFGEDVKMYKDSGLTLLRVMAIFVAVWAAGKSVAEEIDGRTALTVLSKPVSRRQFILGKFMGISLAVGLMFLALGLWFVCWVSYKSVYDAREAVRATIEWSECYRAAINMVPPLFLSFLEVVIFVAIAVAISTRLNVLPSLVICFSIYVLGHLTANLVNSARVVEAFEPVVLFSQVISIVVPVLDHFDMQTAINTDAGVPLDYVGWLFVYTMIYGAMAILLALVLFEDRDLA